jgi:alpha-L-fucosidase
MIKEVIMKILHQSMILSKSNLRSILLVFLTTVISTAGYSQDKELSWEELSEQYEIPEWFSDARFGVWVHWGAQSVPEYGGGWYARHMYMQDVGKETFGKNAYSYHLKTFGHPSKVGYKDVIHAWKAENLNTDSLLQYFTQQLGARYFMALAHHHDNFDNWNSKYQEWNSVNVGPKRDIIGEFCQSAKKYGVPFGVSTHDERFFEWGLPAFGADTSGEFKGVPYDGRLTKEDGDGLWWEGLDPANLYGLPPEKRTPEWEEAWKQNWLLRMKDLLTSYDVDFMWFDGRGFPYGDYGKEVFRAFYNDYLKKHGKLNAVIAGKIPGEKGIVNDVEQGVELDIYPQTWQSICSFTHWFYKKDDPSRHDARSTIELLVDVVSKNGNFMLNVELLPDGTIPPEHKAILDDFGAWMRLNGEAIYASKPWKVYGDNFYTGLTDQDFGNANVANTDLVALKAKKSKQFNNRTKDSEPYGHDEVRFTTKGDVLYVFVLNPKAGEIELPSLGLGSEYQPNKIQFVSLIGSNEKIEFTQTNDKLTLSVPAERPTQYVAVFEVRGAL